MAQFEITVEGGKTVTLPTAGKYVDRDIKITATGGGGSGTDLWSEYAVGRNNEGNWAYGFFRFISYTSLDNYLTHVTTSKTVNCNYMFSYCSKLETMTLKLIISNGDYAFQNCGSLKSLTLDTENMSSGNYMFSNCGSLETIDLTSLNSITSIYSCSYMFQNCFSLTKLIIRNMSKIPTIHSNTFSGCSHILGTQNTLYNPSGAKDGYIYVPDDWVEQLKSSTNWSTVGDQIKPISELEE